MSTFSEILERFRRRVKDYADEHSQVMTAEADQYTFHLGYRNVNSSSFTAYSDEEATGWTSLDPQPTLTAETGWAALDPGEILVEEDDRFLFRFSTNRYHDDLLYDWINAGINALWPQFYVIASEEQDLSASTYEYDVPSGAEKPLIVQTRASSTGRWNDHLAWDLVEGDEKIRFLRGPGSGYMRCIYQTKPNGQVSSTDSASDFDDITELPLQAEEAVILYLEFCAMADRYFSRVETDSAANFLPGNVRLGDMDDAVKAAYSAFATYKNSVAMPPPIMSMRVPV